jgi:hypothetical protein
MNHFEEKLNNILELKKQGYFEETIILIFAYLDYLRGFTEFASIEGKDHRKNTRMFLKTYSQLSEIFGYLQIDKLISHLDKYEVSKNKYAHYLDQETSKLQALKKGGLLPINKFISCQDIPTCDLDFFQDFTLYNWFYSSRNMVIHEYRSSISEDVDMQIPYVFYVENMKQGESGWYSSSIPFSFLYQVLMNCYESVRASNKDFDKKLSGLT